MFLWNSFLGCTFCNDGNFYGTTAHGGTDGVGTVYKMTPAGVFTVLASFSKTDGLGLFPVAGLVQATDGKLYGVTGGSSFGHIFQITTTAPTLT